MDGQDDGYAMVIAQTSYYMYEYIINTRCQHDGKLDVFESKAL